MIDLKNDELLKIKCVLRALLNNEIVIIFGSRIQGNSHEHSDLDLAIKGTEKLSLNLLSEVREVFEESNLIFRVDILDYHRVDQGFQKIILETGVVLEYGVK